MPLYFLLIPYGLLLLVFLVFAGFSVYHMIEFALVEKGSFIATVLFISAAAIILFITWQMTYTVDWSQPLFNIGSFSGPNSSGVPNIYR